MNAQGTVSRLERGVSIPSIKTLEKISLSLDTSFKDLFDFEYSPVSGATEIEKESFKILAFLKTKRAKDIRMCHRILKAVFEQLEKR